MIKTFLLQTPNEWEPLSLLISIIPKGQKQKSATAQVEILYTRGKKVSEKTPFQVRAGTVKRTETRQGWENPRTLPYYEMMAASSLTSKQGWENAKRLPYICKKWEADVQCRVLVFLHSLIHAWRPERKPPSVRSRVVFLSFFTPSLFLSFYRSSPNLKLIFFRNFFPYFLFFFWEGGRILTQLLNRLQKH